MKIKPLEEHPEISSAFGYEIEKFEKRINNINV